MGVSPRSPRGIELLRPGASDDLGPVDEPWHRWYRWFHYAFAALTAVAIAGALTEPGIPTDRRVAGVLAALALAGWFWWRGRWGKLRSNLDALIYFGVLLPLLWVALRMYDGFGLMLFAAFWQGFAFLRLGPALVYALLLSVTIQLAFGNFALSDVTDLELSLPAVLLTLSSLLVAGMMAMYLESLAREVEQRNNLLAELRAAQAALKRQEREAGMQQERQRLAGEIHDTTAQHFASIITNLTAAESRVRTNPDAARDHLDSALTAARQGIVDARRMVRALQPEILAERTLSDALRHTATSADAGPGATVTYHETGEPGAVDRQREAILVRSLQEALTNVRRHAAATNVRVSLTWEDDNVILDVSDDGAGFDPSTVQPSAEGRQIGLTAMRGRVEGAGGIWTMESAPSEGTSLAISFPVSRDHHERTP